MTSEELVLKMLEYGKLRRELLAIEEEIKAEVLSIKKTQNVGNVRASYSKGRRVFDYERTVETYQGEGNDVAAAVNENTKTTVRTNWRAVCKAYGLTPAIASQSEPSVTLKLV